jgi:hypothetical protein
MGFEPTILVVERAKTFPALDRAATVIGPLMTNNAHNYKNKIHLFGKEKPGFYYGVTAIFDKMTGGAQDTKI